MYILRIVSLTVGHQLFTIDNDWISSIPEKSLLEKGGVLRVGRRTETKRHTDRRPTVGKQLRPMSRNDGPFLDVPRSEIIPRLDRSFRTSQFWTTCRDLETTSCLREPTWQPETDRHQIPNPSKYRTPVRPSLEVSGQNPCGNPRHPDYYDGPFRPCPSVPLRRRTAWETDPNPFTVGLTFESLFESTLTKTSSTSYPVTRPWIDSRTSI